MPEITNKQFISDFASATTKVYVWCMRVMHSQIDTVRLVNDRADLLRDDGTYLRFPFVPVPPTQTDQRPPEFEIDVDIVDQRMMEVLRPLRGLREGAQIEMERVWVEQPNTLVWGPGKFRFLSFSTDGLSKGTIKASFIPGALDNVYPVGRFSPANAGGK